MQLPTFIRRSAWPKALAVLIAVGCVGLSAMAALPAAPGSHERSPGEASARLRLFHQERPERTDLLGRLCDLPGALPAHPRPARAPQLGSVREGPSGKADASSRARSTRARSVRPGLILRDQNGQPVRLEDMRGYYVHLDFSATWCRPCHYQARYLRKVEKRLQAYDFVTATIIVTRKPAAVRRWARRYGLTLVLGDYQRKAHRQFNVRGFPTNIILRPDLKVAGRWAGAPRNPRGFEQRLRGIIPEMFARKPHSNNNR